MNPTYSDCAFKLHLLQIKDASQLRFFTMYLLHKTWDDTQLPMRKFDKYLPYVPSKEET